MIRSILLSVLILLGIATATHAQSDPNNSTEEFHYRDGAYGYRAEAQFIDSLAVLETMGELTSKEVRQEQKKFRKAKREKRRKKKDKMRKKRKKKKRKKNQ